MTITFIRALIYFVVTVFAAVFVIFVWPFRWMLDETPGELVVDESLIEDDSTISEDERTGC